MKTLGIDPSSTCTGNALIEQPNILLATEVWKPSRSLSPPAKLYDYFMWQRSMLRAMAPDIVCVESLSVERNAKTTRIVSHFQAAAVLACKAECKIVIEARVSQARLRALGDGSMSKEAAWDAIRKLFPDHRFGQFKTGGGDKTDAVVLALAAGSIAEL